MQFQTGDPFVINIREAEKRSAQVVVMVNSFGFIDPRDAFKLPGAELFRDIGPHAAFQPYEPFALRRHFLHIKVARLSKNLGESFSYIPGIFGHYFGVGGK